MQQRNRQPVRNASRLSRADKPPVSFGKLGLRPVAILLMLAGAASFLISRLLFGDQVLCLLGSTLVTFAGLGLIVAARRYGWGQYARQETASPVAANQSPMGDEAAGQWMEQPGPRQAAARTGQALAERAQEHFEQLGASVTVDASRPGRSILLVQAPDGANYTAMVLEGSAPADVPEARALLALVHQSSSAGGFLISGGSFPQRCAQWIQGKPLQLVEAGRLSRLRFD